MLKRSFRFRRTTVMTVGLIGCLLGVGLTRNGADIHTSWIFVGALLMLATCRELRWPALCAALLLGFTIGLWRGNAFHQKLLPYEDLYGERVMIRAVAETDAVYGNKSQLSFDVTQIKIVEPFEIGLPGRLKIEGFGEPAIYRGDVIEAEAKIFPTGGSRQGRLSFATLKVLGRSGSVIESARREFVAGMQTSLPEPQASFGLGLLVGQRNTLPEEVTLTLAAVGLTHIIAVSGYNLTIIIRSTRKLFSKRSKYQSTIFSLVLIASFLLITGFSASIVRASIVSALSLLAWYYGRTFRPLLLLILAAVITAFWNPIYIWSDIGWYLSFLAFAGILLLAPLVTKRIYGTKKEPRAMAQILIESMCAQIMTLPLILYIFNQTSIVALISNAIIVPLVPVAMLLSLIAGISGMFLPALAGWLAWPASILLTYMLDVAKLLSTVPHALVHSTLALNAMLLMYGLLGFVMIVMWRRLTTQYGKITDKNIIE